MLDTERVDRHSAGTSRQKKVNGEYAILSAALNNVARLDENFVVGRHVLDRKLVNLACLVDNYEAFFHRLLQGKGRFALEGVVAMHEIDRQVFMCIRSREPLAMTEISNLKRWRRLRCREG